MRVFGFSFWGILFIVAAFVVGAKNPSFLARIPLLNRL